MKNLLIAVAITFAISSCSSTRATKKADPQATQYKPMRERTTAKHPDNTPGSQDRAIQNNYNQK